MYICLRVFKKKTLIKSDLLIKVFLVLILGPVRLPVCRLFSSFFKKRFQEFNNILKVTSQQGSLGTYHRTFVQNKSECSIEVVISVVRTYSSR